MKIRVRETITKDFEVDSHTGKKLMKLSMSDVGDQAEFYSWLSSHGNSDWIKTLTVKRLKN